MTLFNYFLHNLNMMIGMNMEKLHHFLFRKVHPSTLGAFRFVFGFLLFIESLRFIKLKLVSDGLVAPKVLFKFPYMEWVPSFSETGYHILIGLMVITSIGIMLGLFLRFCAILFGLSLALIFLQDNTLFNNHFYFFFLLVMALAIFGL